MLGAYVERSGERATGAWRVETPYWKVESLLSWSELLWGPAARSVNLTIGLLAAVGLGVWWRPGRGNQAG